MKKTFAVALLAISLVACGSKKESTTPKDKPAMETKEGATGGAAYGGQKPDGAAKDPANPCAPK